MRLFVVPLLGKLPRLQSLRVMVPGLNERNWLPFCNAMWNPRPLSLCAWHAIHGIHASAVVAGFAAMRLLIILVLERCACTDRIFVSLPAMASIEWLTVMGGATETDVLALMTSAPKPTLELQLKAEVQFPQVKSRFGHADDPVAVRSRRMRRGRTQTPMPWQPELRDHPGSADWLAGHLLFAHRSLSPLLWPRCLPAPLSPLHIRLLAAS